MSSVLVPSSMTHLSCRNGLCCNKYVATDRHEYVYGTYGIGIVLTTNDYTPRTLCPFRLAKRGLLRTKIIHNITYWIY